ncbi:MAG: hypothetical protein IJK44_09290 [Bacteroidales bacterium]|jgi:hypothetical protein|nr:hypothetical protein [Bacteroidales bacterium]
MLEDIRKHIEKLIALYEAEKAENQRLRQELHASEETGVALKEHIKELESGIEARYLADAFSVAGDPVAARERVDKLIREINRCISLVEES